MICKVVAFHTGFESGSFVNENKETVEWHKIVLLDGTRLIKASVTPDLYNQYKDYPVRQDYTCELDVIVSGNDNKLKLVSMKK